MKKTILLFSAIFLLWSCNNETNNTTIPQNSASIYKKESVLGISKHFSGILTEKYSNGQLKKVTCYKDGTKNGLEKVYYENGKIKLEGNYKNNIEDGSFKTYYQNGNLNIDTEFKNGLPNNLFSKYHLNGNLALKGIYKEGKLHGEWKTYYFNGEIESEKNMTMVLILENGKPIMKMAV